MGHQVFQRAADAVPAFRRAQGHAQEVGFGLGAQHQVEHAGQHHADHRRHVGFRRQAVDAVDEAARGAFAPFGQRRGHLVAFDEFPAAHFAQRLIAGQCVDLRAQHGQHEFAGRALAGFVRGQQPGVAGPEILFLHPGQHQAGHAIEIAVDEFLADAGALGDRVDADAAHSGFQDLGFQRLQDLPFGILASRHRPIPS
ncbi:hypothetical protein G6F57_019248 [Rhizopus arrhizus]|nr:hypothetical protein G6F57_019248 [Rhizopus arrhizus]